MAQYADQLLKPSGPAASTRLAPNCIALRAQTCITCSTRSLFGAAVGGGLARPTEWRTVVQGTQHRGGSAYTQRKVRRGRLCDRRCWWCAFAYLELGGFLARFLSGLVAGVFDQPFKTTATSTVVLDSALAVQVPNPPILKPTPATPSKRRRGEQRRGWRTWQRRHRHFRLR